MCLWCRPTCNDVQWWDDGKLAGWICLLLIGERRSIMLRLSDKASNYQERFQCRYQWARIYASFTTEAYFTCPIQFTQLNILPQRWRLCNYQRRWNRWGSRAELSSDSAGTYHSSCSWWVAFRRTENTRMYYWKDATLCDCMVLLLGRIKSLD